MRNVKFVMSIKAIKVISNYFLNIKNIIKLRCIFFVENFVKMKYNTKHTYLGWHLLFIFFLSNSFFTVSLNAQSTKSANEHYEKLEYRKAIRLYENKKNLDLDDIAKLADSYRQINDAQSAEFWYAQLVNRSEEPEHILRYAQMLQINGKSQIAKEYFLIYDKKQGEMSRVKDKVASRAVASINLMHQFNENVTIVNEDRINSEVFEMSPAFFKNGVLFISTQKTEKTDKRMKDNWINDNFMNIFYASKGGGDKLGEPEEFALDLTTKYHEGPVSLTADQKRIFFTRNDFNNGKRNFDSDGMLRLQIYTASKEDEAWSKPEELPFNTKEYDEAHPSVSPDGMKLYFASNRPSGFGGMDLYVSEFLGDRWSAPRNLGENINTPGDEMFPFIHDDGMLYFASDGWGGFGGLDILSSREGKFSQWSKVENLGQPVNSIKDDFGFILNKDGTKGYLTSERDGGKGKDDIYSFTFIDPTTIPMVLCTYEKDSEVELEDVLLTLETLGGEEKEALFAKMTDLRGEVITNLSIGKAYTITAEKEGYKLVEKTISTEEFREDGTKRFCLPMEKIRPLRITGFLKSNSNPVKGAKIYLINQCDGNVSIVKSDEFGFFAEKDLECGCDYLVKINKADYRSIEETVSSKDYDCDKAVSFDWNMVPLNEVPEPVEEEVVAVERPTEMERVPDNRVPTAYEQTQQRIPKETKVYRDPNDPFYGKTMEVGTVIALENIYYDFDQSYIRADASIELNYVVKVMQEYPGMRIELSSHTDSRGNNGYNEALAQRRAEAAVRYIVSRGINSGRIIARGYGETMLRNRCADGVNCSEMEHQYNRRTEIRVLDPGNANIRQ